MIRHITQTSLTLLTLVGAATQAFGHGEGLLVQRHGNRLVTGYDSDSPGGQTIGTRVFSAFMPSNGVTTDPSFVSVSPAPAGAETLAANKDIFWDFLPLTSGKVTSNLLHWDGVGAPAFGAAVGVSLSLYDPNFVAAGVSGAADAVVGRRLGTTTSSALTLHAHRYWELTGGASAPGIYVASIRLRMEGLLPTKPLYVALATFGTPVAALTDTVTWLNENVETLLLKGDYNFDGLVDAADYGVWLQQYGAAAPQSVAVGEADGNGDGVIDAADYTVWRDALVTSPSMAIPEPTGFALLAILLLRRGVGRRAVRV